VPAASQSGVKQAFSGEVAPRNGPTNHINQLFSLSTYHYTVVILKLGVTRRIIEGNPKNKAKEEIYQNLNPYFSLEIPVVDFNYLFMILEHQYNIITL
jgi:hypothetical protein